MAFRNKPLLGIVPARGGSKGLPDKNLRRINGKSLVARAVECGLGSTFVDRVFVTSDDPRILQIGHDLGVEVIKRDPAAATDTATAADVVRDIIAKLPAELTNDDPYLLYLQPTSPKRSPRHIDGVLRAMESRAAHSGVSVVKVKESPFKSFTISAEGSLQPLFEGKRWSANRQSLPDVYRPNGAVYVFRVSDFERAGDFPLQGAVPFVMSEGDSVDVDSEEDLKMIERWDG